ncbi:MAG: MFS transporter [Dehalococcoidia bacterium]
MTSNVHGSHASTSRPAGVHLTRRVCWLALFAVGVYTALLGPTLPDLAERTDTSLGQVGGVFTTIFSVALVSSLLAGRLVDLLGYRAPLVTGLALEGSGLLLLPLASSFPVLLTAGALIGAGDATIIVAAHVFIGRTSDGDEVAALNRLNVFFGVGAVAGPMLAALMHLLGGEPVYLFMALAAIEFASALLILRWGSPPTATVHTQADPALLRAAMFRSVRLWLLAGVLLIYVGLEVGLGAWTFSYAREAAGLGGTAAAVLSGGYWCALTAGRLASPLILRRLSGPAWLVLAVLLSTAGLGALAIAGSEPAVLVGGVLVTGFGFGPVWPVTFALTTRAFPATAGSAGGVLGTVSSGGGIVLPWLLGRVLDVSGPTAVIDVTLIGCVLMLALAMLVARNISRPAPRQTGHG